MLPSFRCPQSLHFHAWHSVCLLPFLEPDFPMMWGPESNWQEPGPNRRGEVNGDLYYAGSGEWTWGKGTQEGAGYLQGWPGTAENTGQPGLSPGGPMLCQGLQYNSSWLGDVGETEGVRQDEVCHVFHWFFPLPMVLFNFERIKCFSFEHPLFSWLGKQNASQNTEYILHELKLINTKSYKPHEWKTYSIIQPP